MQAKILYVKGCKDDPSPTQAFDYETKAQGVAALDEIFREFNHVDGNEEISRKGYQARSLSVGDVVYFPERKSWHVCDVAGWRRVTLDFVHKYLKTVSFKDAMMGLDWVLLQDAELAELMKGAGE